jgi:hypothetical protein
MNWLTTVHHDDKCSFPSKEVDQQLEEGVYREGLF